MVNIGDSVLYVLSSGRPRPALVVERSALLAAQAQMTQAESALKQAQDAFHVAQSAVRDAPLVAPAKGAAVTTLDDARAAVSLMERHNSAVAYADQQLVAVQAAQANLDAAQAAVVAAAEICDLVVFIAGDTDVASIGERLTGASVPWSVPLVVLRTDVAHDANKAPGTWHTSAE